MEGIFVIVQTAYYDPYLLRTIRKRNSRIDDVWNIRSIRWEYIPLYLGGVEYDRIYSSSRDMI